jgi:hypothetical protein
MNNTADLTRDFVFTNPYKPTPIQVMNNTIFCPQEEPNESHGMNALTNKSKTLAGYEIRYPFPPETTMSINGTSTITKSPAENNLVVLTILVLHMKDAMIISGNTIAM